MNLHSNKNLHCCFLLLLLLLPPSSALNTDGISLLSFKYSILSDPLSFLASWNFNDDTPCSWTGVTCDDMFRVTSLILSDSHLLGSISDELGNIKHLQHLDLSHNFFNGSLPTSIFNFSELQVLSLANNVISGDLPELVGDLKSLQILNLSDNAFAGSIPKNLTGLKNLTFVSLKSNYFSGEVPSGLKFESLEVLDLSSNLLNGSLPNDLGGGNLRYLNLSYNKFSGKIPLRFAQAIPKNSTVDLSFNNLTGEIPESLALMNQKTEFFDGNDDLCGKPLKILCSVPSSLSIPPLNASYSSSSSSSSPAIAAIPKTIDTNSETNTSSSSSNGIKPTTIIAIIIGDLVGISILAAAIFIVFHQRNKSENSKAPKIQFVSCLRLLTKHSSSEEETTTTTTTSESDNESNTNNTKIGTTTSDLVTVDAETELDLETLLKASAFVLGTMKRESIVYKAVVEDGRIFAVRRIGECGIQRMKEFENHVKAIARIRHPNLVKVRGFCWGEDEKLLICDFIHNGSLACCFNHRRTTSSSSSSQLNMPLEVRLKIARGIARGLAFIHEKKHVHGNIKPNNILLNSEMEPIISDFGLNWFRPADSVHQHELSMDSSPYQAPESLECTQTNPKWDVYSFGVVLLELLSGRVLLDRELDRWPEAGSVEEEKNRVLRMADVGIKGDVESKEDVILACFKLGFRCASFKPQKRPSMKEALQILEKIYI